MDSQLKHRSAVLSGTAATRVVGRPFPKGQSGNPGGRPRKLFTLLSDAIRAELGEIDPETSMTYAAVIASGLVRIVAAQIKAGHITKEGLAFLREPCDRTEGRPPQKPEIKDIRPVNPAERVRELLGIALARSQEMEESQPRTS